MGQVVVAGVAVIRTGKRAGRVEYEMMRQRVRQVGGSAVVTIPKEDLERLGIKVGDMIAFEPSRIEMVERHILSPEDEAAVATFRSNPSFLAALEYLKDR